RGVVALCAPPPGVDRGADAAAATIADALEHVGRRLLVGMVLDPEAQVMALEGVDQPPAAVADEARPAAEHRGADRVRDAAGRLELLSLGAEPAGQARHADPAPGEQLDGGLDVRVSRPAWREVRVPQVDGRE